MKQCGRMVWRYTRSTWGDVYWIFSKISQTFRWDFSESILMSSLRLSKPPLVLSAAILLSGFSLHQTCLKTWEKFSCRVSDSNPRTDPQWWNCTTRSKLSKNFLYKEHNLLQMHLICQLYHRVVERFIAVIFGGNLWIFSIFCTRT